MYTTQQYTYATKRYLADPHKFLYYKNIMTHYQSIVQASIFLLFHAMPRLFVSRLELSLVLKLSFSMCRPWISRISGCSSLLGFVVGWELLHLPSAI